MIAFLCGLGGCLVGSLGARQLGLLARRYEVVPDGIVWSGRRSSWAVTAVTAGLVEALVALGNLARVSMLLCAIVGLVMAAAALVDLERGVVPRALVYAGAVPVMLIILGSALARGEWAPLGRSLAGAAGALLGLGALHLLDAKLLGFGDVRLAVLGAGALAWLGVGPLVVAGATTWLAAAAFGIPLARARRRLPGNPTVVRFAPWLAVGFVTGCAFSTGLLRALGPG